MSALLVACLSVGLVVLVLPRALQSAAELLYLCADVLAFLVESWDGAWGWIGPWCGRLDTGAGRLDEDRDKSIDALFVPELWGFIDSGEVFLDGLPEYPVVGLGPHAFSCRRRRLPGPVYTHGDH